MQFGYGAAVLYCARTLGYSFELHCRLASERHILAIFLPIFYLDRHQCLSLIKRPGLEPVSRRNIAMNADDVA